MILNIDMTDVLTQAKDMPAEIASLDEVEPGLRGYYAEQDGRIRLDADRHKALLDHLGDLAERDRLASDNAKLQDTQNRRLVADTVRAHLSPFVKAGMLDSAVTVFMAQHKFGIRNGKVIVVGKLGRSDTEMAAIRWMEDDGSTFTPGHNPSGAPGGFSAQIHKLKGHS